MKIDSRDLFHARHQAIEILSTRMAELAGSNDVLDQLGWNILLHSITHLHRCVFWSNLAALGGRATKGISTPAKRRAARRNGKLGGRGHNFDWVQFRALPTPRA